jgi:hypothetical protein
VIAMIGGLPKPCVLGCFASQPANMTTGRKYIQRAKDHELPRLLDHRTRAVLIAIGNEPRGKALDAYLRSLLDPASTVHERPDGQEPDGWSTKGSR